MLAHGPRNAGLDRRGRCGPKSRPGKGLARLVESSGENSTSLDPSGEGAILSPAFTGTRGGGFSSRLIREKTNPSLTSEQLGGHENVRPWYGCIPGPPERGRPWPIQQLSQRSQRWVAGCSCATIAINKLLLRTSRDFP